MFNLAVSGLRFYTPEIFELSLERGRYEFSSGECAVLFDDTGDSRPYSISSACSDETLRFLIRRQPHGALSNFMAELKLGDFVQVSPSFGEFRPIVGEGPTVLIATGVGIAPFLSLLRGMERSNLVTCLYGVRYLNEAIELEHLQEKLNLSLAVSREEYPQHFHGRVTELLDALSFPDNTNYSLCGYDAMTDEVFARLHARGVPARHIHSEVFFRS